MRRLQITMTGYYCSRKNEKLTFKNEPTMKPINKEKFAEKVKLAEAVPVATNDNFSKTNSNTQKSNRAIDIAQIETHFEFLKKLKNPSYDN